jgi:hypothetical protein
MNTKVFNEVKRAYGDCNSNSKERNLNFISSEFVTRDEAFNILDKAIPKGYNDFRAGLLNYFHAKQKFKIAREGSVCLYVYTPKDLDYSFPSMEELKVDEMDTTDDGLVRLWWD